MDQGLSKIQKLTERLYSRSAKKRGNSRHDFPRGGNPEGATKWQEMPEQPDRPPRKKNGPWIFLGVAFFFFLVTTIFGISSLLGNRQSVSTDRVSIVVSGPVQAPAGEGLPFEITIQNNNPTPLDLARLIIEYPAGTRSATDVTAELTREIVEIGTVGIGDPINKKFAAVLFGETGQSKRINVSVEYRVKGSNSVFVSRGGYDVALSSSPVSLEVEGVREVNSGQNVTLNVTVRSNATAAMKNVLLRSAFPFGFTFVSSNLTPIEPGVWALGNMFPGESRVVKIVGRLEGQNDEERVFRFDTGLASATDGHRIGVAFLSNTHTVAIARPFLGLKVKLDGAKENGELVVSPGDVVIGEVEWSNNTQNDLRNVEVTLSLNGPLYTVDSVSAQNGTYRSATKNIVWNGRTEDDLNEPESGDSGRLRFRFVVPQNLSVSSSKDAIMTLAASGRAERSGEDDLPDVVESISSQRVRLAGTLAVDARATYSGIFQNSGPLPPKVDTKTTYTIAWSLSTGLNQIGSVTLSAKLPPNVKWLEQTSPEIERVYYDEDDSLVVWEAGTLKAYTGGKNGPRVAFFQVELEPTLEDVGSAPVIVGTTKIQGEDSITGERVTSSAGSITTYIFNDSIYQQGMDIVVK